MFMEFNVFLYISDPTFLLIVQEQGRSERVTQNLPVLTRRNYSRQRGDYSMVDPGTPAGKLPPEPDPPTMETEGPTPNIGR